MASSSLNSDPRGTVMLDSVDFLYDSYLDEDLKDPPNEQIVRMSYIIEDNIRQSVLVNTGLDHGHMSAVQKKNFTSMLAEMSIPLDRFKSNQFCNSTGGLMPSQVRGLQLRYCESWPLYTYYPGRCNLESIANTTKSD